MIKQIFTWWNSQTVGTFIYTIFFGKFIGSDEFGNKYYENKRNNKRWVIYKGEINASKITSEWYSWMHNISKESPLEKKTTKYSWQKPHIENKTGTKEAYKPNTISKNNKDFKKYEPWNP
tara:strand:- start:120 stop:479 length:360 start_codon:yes stop_codon:yes gene_type:complete